MSLVNFNNLDLNRSQLNHANLDKTRLKNTNLWGAEISHAQHLRARALAKANGIDEIIQPDDAPNQKVLSRALTLSKLWHKLRKLKAQKNEFDQAKTLEYDI